MDMAQGPIREERSKDEVAEREFLKDLHLFMKKRDTPIERIPNLGFKQIDLFLMFQAVKDLGGYHQVTSQQLWKQVYNVLGGNPRSTSAATCTRRHYEKLLLPYECHVKGISMNILPQNQPKPFPYANYRKDDDDGQRPPKRKLLSMPLRQNPHNLQSDPLRRVFPLPYHYPHYYPPSHAVLPPHIGITSTVLSPHRPPAAQPQFSFHPYRLEQADRVKEPLEQLRFLAEQYKTSSGLSEPLDLSDQSKRETNSSPASSFAPPSSSKSPKFLNKPFPLYTTHRLPVVANEGSETQDGEASSEDTPSSSPGKAPEAYVIDVEAMSTSSSPKYDSAPTFRAGKGAATKEQKPSSPKTDFKTQPTEERHGIPEVRGMNLTDMLPSPPRQNGGKMEIEIPLSVFHNWLRLCGSSATMHRAKQLLEEHSRQETDVLLNNLTFHVNPQPEGLAAEDLRLRQRNSPSPTPTDQKTGNHHNQSHNPFTSYKPLPSGGTLKNAVSRDVNPFDQYYINNSYSSKPPNFWDACHKETQALPIQRKMDTSPHAVEQDFAAPKSFNEDTVQGGKSETGPSALLMLNSSSASLLQLTTEEVMKLKKIISSTS